MSTFIRSVSVLAGILGDILPAPDQFVSFDEPPNPKSQPHVPYPEMARKAGIEGMVILQLLVDRAGDVCKVNLLEGLGAGFDESAIESVKQGKWNPARNKGEPVADRVTYPVSLVLKDE